MIIIIIIIIVIVIIIIIIIIITNAIIIIINFLINQTIQSSPIPIQQILNILYIFYNLEYKNGDCHIVGLIVSPNILIVSKGFKNSD